MKLLLLTPVIPYPLSEGGKIAQYAIIDALRKYCTIVLAVPVYSIMDEKNIEALQQRWEDVEIKKIQLFNPGERPGFKTRTKNFFRQNIKKGYNSLISAFKENKKGITYDTNVPYLINLFGIKQTQFINEVSLIISQVKPDIVQIDFLDFIDLVLLIPNHVKKIFVHHELRFVRLQTFFEVRNIKITAYDRYIIEKIKQEELTFLKLYDAVFVFNENDQKQLISGGVENVFTAPFPVLDEYFLPITIENTDIKKLIFLGGENHSPNIDALEWYVQEIALGMNKIKPCVLHVAGNWSAKTIEKYKNNPLIQFEGYIEDLKAYCKHAVMLVPVRMGSGIRTKILYAMAQGIPVISTSLGCQGIMENNESMSIADTPGTFAASFKSILENKKNTLKRVQFAQDIAYKYYSQEASAHLRIQYFKQVLNDTVHA